MTDNIKGKTILLLSGDYHGMHNWIRDALLREGAKEVILKLIGRCKGSFRDTFSMLTPFRYLRNPHDRRNKTRQLIAEIDSYTFDVLLCINRMTYSKSFLDYLRNKNKEVKLFLFLWDTLKYSHPRYQDYFPKFDRVYSFDRDDAEKYGLRYYPDFYIDNGLSDVEPRYDIAYFGNMAWDTVNRMKILRYVQDFCDEQGLKHYLYLLEYRIKAPFIIKKAKEFRDRKAFAEMEKCRPYGFLHKEGVPYEQVDKIYQESRVLIDMNHPNRQGLTMNALTALGKGKKLITTNKRIKEEPFYDPDAIYILDDENPKLDIDFFKRPAKRVNVEHLRVDNWVKHILNDVE